MNDYQKIKETLLVLEEDLDKYEFIMSLSEFLPDFDEKNKIDKYRVYGCQSRVWCYVAEDGTFRFTTESKLVGGLLHILLTRFDNTCVKSQTQQDFDEFMKDIPIGNKITMQRQTGLQSAFDKMRKII